MLTIPRAGQMSHFINDLSMNIFRLPVGWQYVFLGRGFSHVLLSRHKHTTSNQAPMIESSINDA